MIQKKYLLVGVVFGLLFPILSLVADCFIFNDLGFAGMKQRISDNPIHYFIFLAPFILGATFWYIGLMTSRKVKLNEKLQRVNTAMRESNELLDNFNYHVSHDLKTVLNNQLILANMIDKYAKKGDLEKVSEITGKIIVAGKNGMSTVVNFLDISQNGFVVDDLSLPGIPIKTELARIVQENNLSDKIKLVINRTDYETLIIGVKVFETIILNLLTNAIKYNDNEPVMEIELIKNPDDKQLVFKDNGIGIDLEKDYENLFKPFNRISNQKNTEGTGIGLYLINKIVKSLDGKIDVESKLGEGTTFRVTFYD